MVAQTQHKQFSVASSDTLTDADPARRWRVRPEAGLQWQEWGDDTVVYHAASGDTYRLDLVAAEGLHCLQQACNPDDLSRELARRLDVAVDEELRGYAEALITRFNRLGLLEAESIAVE